MAKAFRSRFEINKLPKAWNYQLQFLCVGEVQGKLWLHQLIIVFAGTDNGAETPKSYSKLLQISRTSSSERLDCSNISSLCTGATNKVCQEDRVQRSQR